MLEDFLLQNECGKFTNIKTDYQEIIIFIKRQIYFRKLIIFLFTEK